MNDKQIESLNRARTIQDTRNQTIALKRVQVNLDAIESYANMHEADRQTVRKILSRYNRIWL